MTQNEQVVWGGPIAVCASGAVYAIWACDRVRPMVSADSDEHILSVQRSVAAKWSPALGRELRLRRTLLARTGTGYARVLSVFILETFVVTKVRPPRLSDDAAVLVECRFLGLATR
jgi:hypothetical protein